VRVDQEKSQDSVRTLDRVAAVPRPAPDDRAPRALMLWIAHIPTRKEASHSIAEIKMNARAALKVLQSTCSPNIVSTMPLVVEGV
jgi:hypothetical protein